MILDDNLYKSKVSELKASIYDFDKVAFYKSPYFLAYMDISVSLTTFLPKLKKKDHFKLSQDILFNRNLSYIDQFNPRLHEGLKIIDKDNALANSKENGHIFVTYHTGSYRLILFRLLSKGIRLSVVAQKDFINTNGKELQEIVNKIHIDNPIELDFIPAEDSRLLFKLKSKMKEGNSILFYIDGNTGASEKGNAENDNMSKIDFLSHEIYARQGIAFLAYLTKAPVITAICKRDDALGNSMLISYLNDDCEGESVSREDYVSRLTKKMYQELDEFVGNYPEQWEGWFYINKFYDSQPRQTEGILDRINNSIMDNKIKIKVDDFVEAYSLDDKFYMALKKEFKIFEIDSKKFHLIEFFEEERMIIPNSSLRIEKVDFSWHLIEELVTLNVLMIN